MSLLKKASIITTPTAYAEDFLYNIKPAGGLGNELITNGTFDTDSNWTKGTGWSIANGKATVTSSITDSIYQDALTLGKTFKVTFEITNITSGSLRVGIGINFSDYFTEVGTYTFYGQPSNDTLLRINPSSGTNASIDNVSVKEVADFDFTRNSTGTRLNEDYLIETVATNTPRIDYTNGEPSILLEPSRTNLVSNSNNPYSLEQVTQTSVSSPEGINNAFRLTETTANAQHYAQILSSVTSGVVHTISFFIKKGNGYTTAKLYTQSAKINSDVTVNFETKSITLAGTHIVTGSEKLETYPNDWFRVSYSATPIATGSMYIYAVVKDLSSYTGSTNNYIDYYGFQVEAGSYATSLIHTSGSAVTRSADAANNAGNSDLINSTEGVIYAEIKALADDGTFRLITISAGANNNIVKFGYRSTSQAIYYEVRSGNVSQAFQIYTTQDVLEYHKVAIKYKENDFALYINGSEVMTDNSGIVPVGMNSLQFEDFVGNCKMVAVFKEALSDTELECLTGYNNHELYMNYYNRLSYLGLVEEYNVESDINNYIL